jgi:hypothetical protein
MRRLLVMLMCSTSAQAGVYKWVDADGQVHFSDHAVVQAQQIHITGDSPAMPTKGRLSNESRGTSSHGAGQESPYTDFEVLEPETDHSYQTDQGRVLISLLLRPGLQKGHAVQLRVDGTPMAQRFTTTQLALEKLSVGTHSLQAEVVDGEGHVQVASQPVSFHVQRSAKPSAAP